MDRDQRLREIRERAKSGTLADFMDAAREDVPWLLTEVERLTRAHREEQERADELEGFGREFRALYDRYEPLARMGPESRTPEQSEELRQLALKLREHSEEDGLRAEVLRLKSDVTDWEHRWKTAQANEIAHGTDLERRLGEMGYFPPDPSGEGYVSAMAHCELGLFAVLELKKVRERLEILECHDEDTRGRLRPDVHKDPPPPGCGVWVSKVQLVNRGAFDYPGSCVDG